MIEDIYVLAHEMKNPLCVAKGYLEMLNTKNLNDYKEIIQEEIDSSLEILNEYLEYDKLLMKPEELDLNVLLMDLKKKLKKYLFDKHIFLTINGYDEELYLQGDYAKLMQVFYNIIKNGCEAQAKNIVINYEIINNTVEITITNDGLKISDVDIEKVGNNYSSKVLGHGIGTTLAKKIIVMHGGTIQYQNDNIGVSTIITLPLD